MHVGSKTSPGRIDYEGPTRLCANQRFQACLRVVLAVAVQPGGRVALATRHDSDLGDPQVSDPAAENYVAFACSRPGLHLSLQAVADIKRHPWNRGIELRVEDGSLSAGDVIEVHLGASDAGYRCQSFSEEAFRFCLGVDVRGDGHWLVAGAEEGPAIEIVGNRATALSLVVCDASKPGRKTLRIKTEDAHGNVASAGPEQLRLRLDDGRALGALSMSAGGCAEMEVAVPDDGRPHLLVGEDDTGMFSATSNPVAASPRAGQRLFWGDLHAQSGLCDGTNPPSTLYRYAREAAGLDFAAVTSHDFELTPADWLVIKEATAAANDPGHFVSFLGYEWSGQEQRGGDNNIYFPGDDGELVYSAAFGGYPAWDPAAGLVQVDRDLRETIAAFGEREIMVVPHMGGRRGNLDFFDPRVMPMIEVHSCHRSYDDALREALARGLRLGFNGGSDDHRGAIGDSHCCARDRFFSSHNGLIAVYAEALTRESLWEAFFARRCYATNGVRPILDLSLGDCHMGSECRWPGEGSLHIHLVCDGWLDRVELWANDQLLQEFSSPGNKVRDFEREVALEEPSVDTAYWLRVFQSNGGKAWSSPIWVCVD